MKQAEDDDLTIIDEEGIHSDPFSDHTVIDEQQYSIDSIIHKPSQKQHQKLHGWMKVLLIVLIIVVVVGALMLIAYELFIREYLQSLWTKIICSV